MRLFPKYPRRLLNTTALTVFYVNGPPLTIGANVLNLLCSVFVFKLPFGGLKAIYQKLLKEIDGYNFQQR